MFVKICGITRHEDAAAAVQAGADALGFNFYSSSPRYITPERASTIGVGLKTLRVGVFVDESPATIASITEQARLDIVQLHGEEPAHLLPAGARIWKAFRVKAGWSPAVMKQYDKVEAFLLDGPLPGSGRAFDWSAARERKERIVLAGGLGPDNVAAAIREVRPWGVDACSRLESAPGIKDHLRMRQFIEAALKESHT